MHNCVCSARRLPPAQLAEAVKGPALSSANAALTQLYEPSLLLDLVVDIYQAVRGLTADLLSMQVGTGLAG